MKEKTNGTDMPKEDDKEVNVQAFQHLECYCCHKPKTESEGKWISATSSGKCRDKTNAEKRFVCKGCNHERT